MYDQINKGARLGSGAYGDVFAAKLTLKGSGKVVDAAMKVPVDSQRDKMKQNMLTMISYDSYRYIYLADNFYFHKNIPYF